MSKRAAPVIVKKAPAKNEKRSAVAQEPAKASPARFDPNLIALLIVLFCVALIRFGLLDIPLERDEGEYAYIGKLILEGVAPYKSAYNMKLPGTYAMYALLMSVLGATISGIHLGLLLINAATSVFLFLAFRKLYNSQIAFFAASVYALMTLSPAFLGFAAHATHFIGFFVSLGLFFLSRYYNKASLLAGLLSGSMFGLAFLMKQQAVFFIVFGGLSLLLIAWLHQKQKISTVAIHGFGFSIGAVIPYLLTVLILLGAGAFDKFWFWTVTYASEYVGRVSLEEGKMLLSMMFAPMWEEFKVIWILFFAGLGLTFLSGLSLTQKIIAVLFALFAFLTVCPGLLFRSHYFVSFLPAVGLLAAISIYYLSDLASRFLKLRSLAYVPMIIFAVIFISVVTSAKAYYMAAEPLEVSKAYYGANPFVESVEIADYIKRNSSSTDKIAIMGSEPQIFLYADRRSATGYIYTYALVEPQAYNLQMQKEMIKEIEAAKPKFLVSCVVNYSWLRSPGAPSLIFDWFTIYAQDNYSIVGITDMQPSGSIYKWGAEALNYAPTSDNFVLIFKRKDLPTAAQ